MRPPAPDRPGLEASRARPTTADEAFGVYLHVPFCRQRCDYCAFATYTDRDHLIEAYVDACRAEVDRAVDEGMPSASSVFIGGGTPSRLPADLLAGLLQAVPRRPGCEVTVECNPEDVDDDRLSAYRTAGVTRISMGAQSLVPRVLAGLGRRHGTSAVIEAAAAVAAADFESWNLDLICGARVESDEEWAATLGGVLALEDPPPHLSVYLLTVEAGTPLAADPERHPDDDIQAARYEYTDRVLQAAGYEWEEISNWAQPGHRCVHNRLYWRQGEYRGLGSSAHSHLDGQRFWNVRRPERYVELVRSGRNPVAGSERLDPAQRRFEGLALSLRTPAGVPTESLPDAPELAGLVSRRDGRAVLTVRGRLVADAVTRRLDVGVPPTDGGRRSPGTMPGMSEPGASFVTVAVGALPGGSSAGPAPVPSVTPRHGPT